MTREFREAVKRLVCFIYSFNLHFPRKNPFEIKNFLARESWPRLAAGHRSYRTFTAKIGKVNTVIKKIIKTFFS